LGDKYSEWKVGRLGDERKGVRNADFIIIKKLVNKQLVIA
jgi:hypothetical protein